MDVFYGSGEMGRIDIDTVGKGDRKPSAECGMSMGLRRCLWGAELQTVCLCEDPELNHKALERSECGILLPPVSHTEIVYRSPSQPTCNKQGRSLCFAQNFGTGSPMSLKS